MSLVVGLIDGLWAAIFAAAFGLLLSMPARGLPTCALCGFAGSFLRAVATALEFSTSWATVVGAIGVVLVATIDIREYKLAPVAVVSGVFPLGAAVAYFKTIAGTLRLASMEGPELLNASVQLVANASRAFTITLAIALGVGTGAAIVEMIARIRARGRQ